MASWKFAGLCGELALVHAVDPFAARQLAGSFKYFRLHGIGGARYRDGNDDLARLAAWTTGGPAYVFFNHVHTCWRTPGDF